MVKTHINYVDTQLTQMMHGSGVRTCATDARTFIVVAHLN